MFDSSYLMLYYFSWKNKKNKSVKVNKTIPITNSFDTDTTEKFFYYHDVYCK